MTDTINNFPITTKSWPDFTTHDDIQDSDLFLSRRGSTTEPLTGSGLKEEIANYSRQEFSKYSVVDYTELQSITIADFNDGDVVTVTEEGIAGGFVLRNVVGHGLTNTGITRVINADWYAERLNDGKVLASWYSITPYSLDNSPEWQSLLNSNPSHVHFSLPGNYKFLSSCDHNYSINITAASGVVIDCTDAGFIGDYWTKFSGSLPQIQDIAANASKGDRTITFSSPPSLQPDDIFIIFNPTSSSWSGFRPVYFAGEFCRVVSVSGSTVVVAGELYDSYNALDVDVYRLDSIRVNADNLTVNGNLSSSLIDLEFCRDSLLSNIKSNHKNNSCITFQRSYNCAAFNPSIFNEGDGGDDYGIVVTNSQTIRVNNGSVHSRRHAITTGGDGEIGAVPCRDLRFSNLTLSNDINSGTHCADFHGNTEDSQYVNCEIYGGATWQGKNNGYVNCRIGHILAGPCILGSEILGGHHYARGCQFHSYIDPFSTSRALIDVGGNSSAVSDSTTEDCTFELLGCTVNGKNFSSSTSIANMRNRGASVKLNYIIDNLRLYVNDMGQVLFTSNEGAGTANSDYIVVDNIIASGISGKIICNHNNDDYVDFPHRLQKQTGREQVTTNTGSSFVSGTPVIFKWVYPRTPVVAMSSTNRGYIGNRIGLAYSDPVSITGLTPIIATSDGVNFSSAQAVDLNWQVEIAEV